MPEMVLDNWQINARKAYPLDLKIDMSMRRIEDWYSHWSGKVFVSYSGGKDSTVLLHLVRSRYPQVKAVFCDTGLEYPEVRDFARTTPNTETIRPKITFKDVIEQYGWPVISRRQAQYLKEAGRCKLDSPNYRLRMTGVKTSGRFSSMSLISKKYQFLVPMIRDKKLKVSDMCCQVMKKDPLNEYLKDHQEYPLIGVTADESKNRELSWKMYGCNAYNIEHPASRPLMAWSEQDILQYLVDNKLPIAKVYGDIVANQEGQLRTTGVTRTGCMFCGFGVHLEQYPNRFQMMKETHPAQWNYIINKLGMKQLLDLLNIPYEPEDGGILDLFAMDCEPCSDPDPMT